MCGRYLLDLPGSTLAGLLDAIDATGGFQPRFNVAPSQLVPVLALEKLESRRGEPRRVLELAEWGLVPGWARRPDREQKPLINARGETAAEKPSFRSAFQRHRVLVPATAFYEWQQATGGKVPHAIRVRGEAVDPATGRGLRRDAEPGEIARPFTMAGIAEVFVDDDGIPLVTVAILTCEANELVAPIHDRMPVILEGDDAHDWMATPPEAAGELQRLIRPFDAGRMEAWTIGREVGNARNDHPGIPQPLLV